MNVIHTIASICVWLALIMNGWMIWRNAKLIKQLRRDTRIVAGYKAYYEERARKEGHNFPFPTPEELEGEET